MTGIRKFNWVQRPSTWEYVQAWKEQRRKMTQRFLEEGAAANAGFASAQHNLTTGMTSLIQQAAITRLQKKA